MSGTPVDTQLWGTIYLGPGQQATWWFTWGDVFQSGLRWARMSGAPLRDSPPGSAVEIMEEWTTGGTLWVRWRNRGTAGVIFRPVVLAAPPRSF